MSAYQGFCGRQTAKEKRERKRAETAGEIPIIGPRESQCGAAGFAVKTDTRYACQRCGNYHEESATVEGVAA